MSSSWHIFQYIHALSQSKEVSERRSLLLTAYKRSAVRGVTHGASMQHGVMQTYTPPMSEQLSELLTHRITNPTLRTLVWG